MRSEQFATMFAELQYREQKLLVEKAAEYATDEDRMANFKNALHLQLPPDTPEACAWNYMAKHLEASMQGLRQLGEGQAMPLDFWREKLGDIRVYCSLILGMLEQREWDLLEECRAEPVHVD